MIRVIIFGRLISLWFVERIGRREKLKLLEG